jgi:hypothetical protein
VRAYVVGSSFGRRRVWNHTPATSVAPTTINAIAHDPTGAMTMSHVLVIMLGAASS